ncbi:MAG TPA: PilZ domain-containing protein [Thermoanaerobaculia bacterium]|nr:PilZ domain-containing protein [Thermoanaerobaculia bacterium]
MTMEEQRLYRRMAAGVRVLYRGHSLRKPEAQYLTGIAEDLGLGGMFISTRHPLPKGTLLSLEFHTSGDDGRPVRARAIVRWRRLFGRPRGMGVQFVEFEGLGHRQVENWIDGVLLPEPIAC